MCKVGFVAPSELQGPQRHAAEATYLAVCPKRRPAQALCNSADPRLTPRDGQVRAPGRNQGVEDDDDAEADMPLAEASGAICVQRFDDSHDSAIHTTYRISLRSSSLREPRYPLLRVVFS